MNAADVEDLLGASNAKLLTYRDVLEVSDKGVVITGEQDKRSTLEADTIILAVRLKPNSGLVAALQDKLPEVYAIGDCVESRLVLDAIKEGFRTARLI
jgi:thioredoxin reductase